MSYLDRNLLSDEVILFRTKKHFILFFIPVILTFFSVFVFYYMRHNPILFHLRWLPWLVAGVSWVSTGLDYLTSEFAVTNKRVMMREGFFVRHATEMRIAAISQVNVAQSILGQLLNYGMVAINAFGAYDSFPLIAKPYAFQKAVNEELDKHSR